MPPLTPHEIATLTERAAQAAHNAYAPYSHFRVGAALMLQDGAIVIGVNVENASYRLTCCAEQAAIASAVSLYGPAIRLRAVAIANLNGVDLTPCGACRQTILEFASPDTPILYPSPTGETLSTTLAEMLPGGFRLLPE